MPSNRVVHVRTGDGGSPRRAAGGHRADPGGARGQRRSSRRRWSRPPPRRPTPRGCPTSTAPTSRSSPSTRPASMDLDQALHIERDGDGYVVHYAIADVAAFVAPGDPVDLEAHRRGETLYGADSKVPAAPEGDLGGRRLAAARPGPPGAAVDDQGGRDRRGHRRQRRAGAGALDRELDYEGAQRPIDDGSAGETLLLLAEVGTAAAEPRGGPRRRLAAAARAGGRRLRASVDAGVPLAAAGRAVERPDLVAHRLRGRLAHGLRPGRPAAHPAAPGPARRPAAAPHGARAGHRLAGRAALPRLHPLPRPPPPDHAAMVMACTRLLRGSGYVGFDGEVPGQPQHAALASEYAHVTAPLRRLGDRYAGEVCVALCAGTDGARLGAGPAARAAQDAAGVRAPRPAIRERGHRPGGGRRAADARGGEFDGRRRGCDEKDRRRGSSPSRTPRSRPGSAASATAARHRRPVTLTAADVGSRSVSFELA